MVRASGIRGSAASADALTAEGCAPANGVAAGSPLSRGAVAGDPAIASVPETASMPEPASSCGRAVDTIIEFDHVEKSFGETEVLHGIDLAVHRGEFLTIVGRSGCGKTTLLKMVNALEYPDRGRVLVNGEEVQEKNRVELRRSIGYVIQSVGLFPNMTVARNVAYVPRLTHAWSKTQERDEVARLLATVGLDPAIASRYPSELSGGQRQRVGIARGLAAKPLIMLMDEPFGAVDEITRRALQDELLDLQRRLGLTIMLVTHDIREALKLGDRVLVMEDGRIAQLGSPSVLVEHPADSFVEELING
ncbi:ATP-binding cassette domain-containing protein [Raoultibacter phocaeensis]|uniref:ATP-binding cassette domain-containing protein n=1 Tax=Raoultibacter phocaeensis TaxID=2479841 RepID=UPI0021033D38|nr:ABC transporter ATP-binding protein [Raoultibacter phocaeensis]